MSEALTIFSAAPAIPDFQPALAVATLEQKDTVLATSSLIGKVTNQVENDRATEARKGLKSLAAAIERARKAITDPIVELQRKYIRAVEPHCYELKREDARLEELQKGFVRDEQRRIREEQEAQARELARIEAELQAELKRIADEQARVEREAREAREKFDRDNPITTKCGLLWRAGLEIPLPEADAVSVANGFRCAEQFVRHLESKQAELTKQEDAAKQSAAIATQQAEIVQENADLKARLESKPVEMTRSVGQTNRKVWEIKQINSFVLMKARPDLVRKIEFDITAIKQELNEGKTLPGVEAVQDLKVGTRAGGMRVIEV